jgi:hypothetical protein
VQPGRFTVSVREVSKSGGKLKVSVDGKSVERDFPAGDKDHAPASADAVLTAEVPAGAHVITVENVGADWLALRDFSFSDYAPALAAKARMSKEYAAAWIYNRAQWDAPKDAHLTPASGRIVLTGLQPGKYRATWWDTREGKSIDASEMNVTKDKESPTVATPPIERDVALYVTKATTPKDKVAKRSHKGPQSIYAPAASESATGPANDARGAGTAGTAAARPVGQGTAIAPGTPTSAASPGQPFNGRP